MVMKKLFDFLLGHKYAIFWTVGYFCVVWMVLYFLFNFDFFNVAQLQRLFNAHLRGFPGFVFGLLVLAAMPLYVATTTIIVRKKKPLITLPVPDIKKLSVFNKTKVPDVVKEEEKEVEESKEKEFPKDLPIEMRPVFLRAQQNLLLLQQSVGGDTLNSLSENTEQLSDVVDTLPVPTDFDVGFDDDIDEFDEEQGFGMPVFGDAVPVFKDLSEDLSFGSGHEKSEKDADDKIKIDGIVGSESDGLRDNSQLIKYLSEKNCLFNIEEGVLVTENKAIVVHSDTDFWVADTENWFASGKICESPIVLVKRVAKKYNLSPVLYLQAKNILDIDNLAVQWKNDGVDVVMSLEEI